MEVIGAVDNDPPLREAGSPPVLGSLDDLGRLLGEGRADRVIVCFSHAGDGQIAEVLRACDEHDVELEMVPRMFDLVGPTQRSRSVGGFPLVSLSGGGPRKGQAIAKRTFDVLFASGFLLVALPLMAIIGLAIVLDSRGAVFYRSNRLGRAGRPFQMLKFRTMVEGADRVESKAVAGLIAGELKREDDPRITRVGRLLRRASLDELPQLLNVVGGSMSVVGPRPVLATEAAGIEGWASRRHNVRPGITGLWQVLGRSTIPWAERMQLDYSYARHWSLVSDLSILARTVSAILSRRGAF
jgi:exopolysaccharide biosynthesis polyprenyl glycosylphosphotransferase